MSQSAGGIVSRSLRSAAFSLCLLALTGTSALAAGKQDQERAARKACLSGEYAKGVAILAELFVDTKDPTYLFNQGRCFEQNRRYEDAIARFEEYLVAAEGKLDAADRAAAEKRIADCRQRLPDQSSTSQTSALQPITPASPPPASTTPPLQPTSTLESSTSIAAQPEPQPTPTHRRSGLRVAGIVTASVGVAAAVAGVFLNLKANSVVNDMETTVVNYQARDSDRKSYETMAWIGYGVGAACVVTGAILYGLGLRARADSSTHVALLPAVGPGQAGALLTGGF